MTRVLTRARTFLAVAVAAVLTVLVAPPPAQAAGEEYVDLTSPWATPTPRAPAPARYLDDGTSCQRSPYAYPSLISAARGYALNFRACSGATIPDVTNGQLSALSAATTYVSVSVGGNDAGFADVLTECAFPWWASDCDGAIDGAQAYINGPMPGQLATLYGQIRGLAPSANVVVVGYPRIFNGEDCNAATWFSPDEEARLNQTADLINARTAAVAAAAGFGFADPAPVFVGHAVCDSPEWLNGLSYPISESYHPNVAGHASGYTPTVSPVLTGSAVAVTRQVRTTARASATDQAALQRTYAASDAGIRPERFLAPDMRSPRVRSGRRAARDRPRPLAGAPGPVGGHQQTR